jgi:hypothetical protein
MVNVLAIYLAKIRLIILGLRLYLFFGLGCVGCIAVDPIFTSIITALAALVLYLVLTYNLAFLLAIFGAAIFSFVFAFVCLIFIMTSVLLIFVCA